MYRDGLGCYAHHRAANFSFSLTGQLHEIHLLSVEIRLLLSRSVPVPLYRPEVDPPGHPSSVQDLVMSMSVNLPSPQHQRRVSHPILSSSTRFGTCQHCVARWQLEDRSDPGSSVLLHRLKRQVAHLESVGSYPRLLEVLEVSQNLF